MELIHLSNSKESSPLGGGDGTSQRLGRGALFTILFVGITFVCTKLIISAVKSTSYDGVGFGWYATAISLGLVIALVSLQLLDFTFSGRRRMLAQMAFSNLRRRKRNTALVIVGLLIGSAIITSSLVVGDSLDATLQAEFAEALDEADIIISGSDLFGNPVWMNQTRMEDFVDIVFNNSDIDAVSIGINMQIGLKSELHKTVEANDAHWLAMDEDYQNQGSWNPFGGAGGPQYSEINDGEVYISEKAAEKMELEIGNTVEVSWSAVSQTGQVNRDTINLTVQDIVPTKVSGYEFGGDSTIYTSLSQAQEILEREGEINRIAISAMGGVLDAQDAEERALPFINSTLDEVIIAGDSGLNIATVPEDFSLAVQRISGEGLLYGDEVESLRENITSFSPDASVAELLMAPLLQISSDGENLTGLISAEVTAIDSDGIADWYATPSGLSVQMRNTSQWFQWVPRGDDETAIHSIHSLRDGVALSLHSGGIRLSALSEDEDSRDITMPEGDGELVSLVVSEADLGVALRISEEGAELLFGEAYSDGAIVWDSATIDLSNFSQNLEHGGLALEGDFLYLRLESAFASSTCEIPIQEINSEFNSCNWNVDPPSSRSITTSGGLAWDVYGQDLQLTSARFDGAPVSAHDLGLPTGEILSVSPTSVVVEEQGLFRWNGSGFSLADTQPASGSDNRTTWSDGEKTITTSPYGVLISQGGNVSGRLPYQISVDGISNLPLVAIALTGGVGIPNPEPGDLYLSTWSANGLALTPPKSLQVVGLMAAARGIFEPMDFNYTFTVPELPAPPGQPGLDDISIAVVNISDAQQLLNRDEQVRSMVMVSGFALVSDDNLSKLEANITAWADEISTAKSVGIKTVALKSEIREATADSGANFSALFLIFGSFVIFAGVLLVMNLFVMLADERKSEMGMLRALGMHRGELRGMFVIEGTLIGLVSSAVGAVIGIGVAKLLMLGLDRVLSQTFQRGIIFSWEWHSLLSGFSIGFLVTFTTLMATSIYISRLNVVAAMRDIPTRMKGSLPWWTILISLFMLGSAIVCAVLAFMIGDPETGSRYAWWLTAGFLFLFGLVPPLFFAFSKLLPESIAFRGTRISRTILTPRLTMTILGLLMFGWGIWTDPIRADWELGDASFIILGLFLVGAGVLLLTSLAPMIARSLAKAGSSISGRLSSVLPTALAYPLATPFRTAMTMGMFSLVVFAVVVLSGYSALVGNWLGDIGEDARGEWEIVAFGDLDLGDNSSEWDLGELQSSDFDAIATMHTATVQVYQKGETDLENKSTYTSIRGFDSNFTSLNGLPLDSWAPSLGDNAEDVWQAILENDTLVVIDYTMAVESYQGEQGVIYEGMGLNIGDAIIVQDPFNPAVNATFFIGAVMNEESGWFASGVSVAKPIAVERFEATPTSIWFSLPPGVTLEEQEEVAKVLQFELVEEGAIVFAIEVQFKEIQSIIFAMFSLLQAFLALGLIVGIAGLGVITIRNVSERAHQTGILRALGFQRSMVIAGYLTELTWVSLLGILNGAAVGVGFHYQLYVKFLKDEGAEFVLPWGQISLIILGAYLLTILATAWPVRRAASIHPAEALRDIE